MSGLRKTAIVFGALVLAVVVSFAVTGMSSRPISPTDLVFLPVLISSALVDSVNPCAFSVLVITMSFLFGLGISRGRVLKIGGAYIAGIFLVYFMVGLGLLRVFSFFGIPHILGKTGAAVLLFLGLLAILSFSFPQLSVKFKLPDFIHGKMAALISKASFPGALFLGILVALFEFPCTGGPYLMILGLLHDNATGIGLSYLFLYNLIFIMPLVVILLVASDPTLIKKAEEWKKQAAGRGRLFAGVAMILLAFVIFLTS